MNMIRCLKIIIVFLVLWVQYSAGQEAGIPKLREPVTDLTGTLSSAEVRTLESVIMRFEDSTSNQIAVLMIPTLGGSDIREYGIEVLKTNNIGQKGRDNGILFVIAKDDRRIAIEVGYGLEGVLPDALADQIIRNDVRPRFREGDYFRGIAAGILAVMQATQGEYKGEKKSKRGQGGSFFALLVVLGVFGTIVLSFMRGATRHSISSNGYRSRYTGGWWWGGGLGGGGFGGGGFGGGGFSGGGWSAGGGSFGGGGASGSW